MMAELLHSSSSSCPPFSTSLQPSFLFLSRENNNNFKHPPISSSCTHFSMDFLRRRHRPAGPGGGGRTTRSSSSSSDCKIVGSTKVLRGFTHQVLTVTTTTTGGRSSRRRKEIITTSQQSFQDAASSSTTTGNNKKQNVFLGQSFLGVDDFFFRGQCGRRRRKLVLQQCESERASAFNLDSETSKYLAIGEQQRDIGSFGSLDGGVELDTSVSDFFVAEKSVAAAGAGGGGGGAKDDGIDVAVAIFDSTAGKQQLDFLSLSLSLLIACIIFPSQHFFPWICLLFLCSHRFSSFDHSQGQQLTLQFVSEFSQVMNS